MHGQEAWDVPITVKGLVIPAAWSASGQVTGVILAGFDENDYSIENREIGDALMAFLHQAVDVHGRVTNLEKGRGKIIVDRFRTALHV